ncbi:response regulator [Colwellia sp. MEBiC06753]
MNKFIFKDEAPEEVSTKKPEQKYWRILVVDDDESVHQVTKLVLADAEIEHRKLELVSVYSSQEAQALLKKDNSFAMAFIDVVMETDHAGLELVQWIRNELKNQAIRLVLRTGQAGTAPEAKVIKEFDINDYKEKTDFTSGKMVTTVYAGIRAYRDIMTIQRSLDAFKKLIAATHDLLKVKHIRSFGSAALQHLLSLMNVESSALYIARNQLEIDSQTTNMIIACTGKYISESDSLEKSDIDEDVKQRITDTFKRKSHYSDENCFIGYYETSSNAASVLYIEYENDAEHFKANLAELYATNVALILEGLTRQHQVENTQKELLYIVGEAIEAKSKETGAHVQRVALICELFAQKLGLSEQFIDAIKLAAPLHDIGKVAIPERILNKPGKLNDEEWAIMKTHAEVGSDMLAKSTAGIAKLSARLAHYHHENWDGSGYPDGLAGENIPLEARIMAVADVFDALGSKRCYTEKWQEQDIKDFIQAQRGIKFEPKLVDILFDNYQEFTEIRSLHPDE